MQAATSCFRRTDDTGFLEDFGAEQTAARGKLRAAKQDYPWIERWRPDDVGIFAVNVRVDGESRVPTFPGKKGPPRLRPLRQ
jgi:hypothetical protein